MEFTKKYYAAVQNFTTEYSTCYKNVPAPLFRKSFTVTQTPDSAELLISGLGLYELYLNGERITRGVLASYICDSDKITYYDRYDLKEKLRPGENVLGVMLGNGMLSSPVLAWDYLKTDNRSAPKLALFFEMTCGDQTLRFDAGDCLCCAESEIVFNDLRCGVYCDMTRAQPGWNAPGFDDSGWHAPYRCDSPRGQLRLNRCDPIIVERELTPVSVRPGDLCEFQECGLVQAQHMPPVLNRHAPRTGGFLYDFGVDTAGVLRLKIHGRRGQKLYLQTGEQLVDGKLFYQWMSFSPDGYQQQLTYVCGGEEEEFTAPFTYQGLRYVYVWGLEPEQATEDLLTFCVVHSDVRQRGSFECSDEIANKLQQAARNSTLSNLVFFPTDCPHREKNGWTGDASMSCEHMLLNLEVERVFREWMNHIRVAQRLDGAIPCVVPNAADYGFQWGNGPAWDGVVFNLPYFVYLYRGETDMIRENAHMMLRYLDFIADRRDDDGIVEMGLGDWVPCGHVHDRYAVPVGFTDSVMVMDMCRKGAVMFRAIGQERNAAYCDALYAELRPAIRKRYVDFGSMCVEGNSIGGQAIAIYYDVLEPAEKQQAFEKMLAMIHENGDHMAGGFLTLRVLFHVLAQYGQWDLAYHMITRTDSLSYGHSIALGATSIWEAYHVDEKIVHHTGSFNHHFLADITHFFLRQIGGINVNPSGNNCNEVLIHPHFIEKLDHARACHEVPAGQVEVEWQRDGQDILLTVKAAPGVKLRVTLDAGWHFVEPPEHRAFTNAFPGTLRVTPGTPGNIF